MPGRETLSEAGAIDVNQGQPIRSRVGQHQRSQASEFLDLKTAITSLWSATITTEVAMSYMFNSHPAITFQTV